MLDITKPANTGNRGARRARGSRRRRRAAAATPLPLIVAAGFAAWARFFSPVKVTVAHPAADVAVEVFGLGTVEARVTSQVGFKVSGVLVDLRADVGERVAKDTVLARLDDREQRAQVARAAAAVQQAAANLQRAGAGVEKAKANAANAKSISERRQKLVESKVTSVETAQTAQAVQEVALADLDLANSDVLVAKAAIADAKAQQQLQQCTLDFHTLAAPYDAMVTARLKELGSALGAGQTVFTLIDPKTIWVLAYIDESKAGEIKVGQPAVIVLRSRPSQRLKGHVARIEPESDRVNEERKIEIAFDQIPAYANLGEQAEVYITTRALAGGLAGAGGGDHRAGQEQRHGVDGRGRASATARGDARPSNARRPFEIAGGVPARPQVVTQLRGGLRVGARRHQIAGQDCQRAEAMNLAYRDIKHNLLRFVLTNFGLSLLLGIVIVITGVYGGLIDDALAAGARRPRRSLGGRGRHQRAFRRGLAHSGRHA